MHVAVNCRVGGPAVVVAGVENIFWTVGFEPGVCGDVCDGDQAIEIYLVAGDGFGGRGEGGYDECGFGGVGWFARPLKRARRVFLFWAARRIAWLGESAEAARAVGAWMEDHAQAGDGFVGFWQAHGDVVGEEAVWIGDAHKVRRLNVVAATDVGRADFYEVDVAKLEFFSSGAKPQALVVFPAGDVLRAGIGEVLFDGLDLLSECWFFACFQHRLGI